MKYVVDTHALIWFLANPSRLGPAAVKVFADPANEFILPAIALAEICWIVEHWVVGLNISDVLKALHSHTRFIIYPLDRIVIEKSNTLQFIGEMHDRQIVAMTILL